MNEWEKPDKEIISFMNDLKALMVKHGIEITAADEWEGYSECGEDIQITIESATNAYSVGAWITPDLIDRALEEYKSGK